MSTHLKRARRLLAIACLLLFLSGCGRQPEYPPPPDGVSCFPTGEPLRAGDVILARSYGLIGAMFANHSEEGGRYSHGAMIYRGRDGRLMVLNYRPTGMETCTPEEFFTRYNRLALVRHNGGLDEARHPPYLDADSAQPGGDAVSATALYWLDKNAANRIPPDYRLDHDNHDAMFCLELTSTVYRDCGLPDPFHKAKKADDDPVLKTANELFKAGVHEIRSPSSALSHPDFHLVADWIRPEYDLREEALNEELMRIVVADIESGLRPRRPRLGGRLKVRQIFVLYHLVTKSMFWRPKQDLPDFIDTEVVDNAFMLYSYVAKSKQAAKKRILAESHPVHIADANPEPVLEYVRCVVRDELDRRRETYLQHPPAVSTNDCEYRGKRIGGFSEQTY